MSGDKAVLRVRSDGLELAVETTGKGPWLVFAHGLTGNRGVTLRQFAPLADRFRIAAFDQRGHAGSTPVTAPALYDQERMAGDITAVMDALAIDDAVVGGESMGAATALRFALRSPGRVRALLLTAPAFGPEPNPSADLLREMGREMRVFGMDGYLRRSAERLRGRGVPEGVIEAIADMQSSHKAASLATACEACSRWVMGDMAAAAGLALPACLIGWEGDLLHPYALAKRLASLLPKSRLEALPSLATLFSRPGEVGRIYGSFLGEITT